MPEHEKALPQRRFLAKPTTRPRQFHLHAVVLGESFWNEHIAFRDALRKDTKLAKEYESLKQQSAARFLDDRESYTESKTDFIKANVCRVLGESMPGPSYQGFAEFALTTYARCFLVHNHAMQAIL
jgi:GrpB-like predicted nucleotidyltransferase (UPF0157 family)